MEKEEEKLAVTEHQDDSVQAACNPRLRNENPQRLERLNAVNTLHTAHRHKKQLLWALGSGRVAQQELPGHRTRGLSLQLHDCPRMEGCG